MSTIAQMVTRIQTAVGAVIEDLASTNDEITCAVVGRNTNTHLVLDSSFLHRDKQTLKTRQSPRRLIATLVPKGKGVSSTSVAILDGSSFKRNWQIQSQVDSSKLVPLPAAVTQEIKSVGDLIFVLIGQIKGLRAAEHEVQSSVVKAIWLMPASTGADVEKVDKGIFSIRRFLPIEDLLLQLGDALGQPGGLSAKDRNAIADAYGKMHDAAITDVVVPMAKVAKPDETVLGQIVSSLRTETAEYKTALAALQSKPEDRRSLNEVLRIAYNFSTDVLPLVYLFMSIADLKPLIFWFTVQEQWALCQAFASLPWPTSGRKQSLEEYKAIIAQARSYAFHHILPFDSTVEADLSRLNVRAQTIRLFVPYGQKEGRGVFIEDQALVDVLKEFSRAKERPVSNAFWWANLKVIEAVHELAQKVLDALVLVHEARRC